MLWVNVDRQFSYGLLVFGIFCLAACVEQLCSRAHVTWFETSNCVPLGIVPIVAIATLLATLLSPYTWRLPALVWHSLGNSPADRYFRELHSMRFRQPQDYLLMLLVMTAFFALGRRRSRDLFLISLLAVSAVISFRIMRDNWFVVVVSIAVIGSALYTKQAGAEHSGSWHLSRAEKLWTAALVLVVIFANEPKGLFLLRISKIFPVRAAEYIRQNHLPQPLFNVYEWGGFLTWYLPEYPVVIDGRVDLYGDEFNIAYFKLMQAEVPLESDPGFARAQTILLEANSPMAQALSTLPGFRVAYQDEQSVVLVRAPR